MSGALPDITGLYNSLYMISCFSEGFSKLLDVGIDSSGIAVVINSPDSLKDLVTSEDLTRVGSEKIEDLNFLGCAGNILTIGLNSIVIEVDLKTVK